LSRQAQNFRNEDSKPFGMSWQIDTQKVAGVLKQRGLFMFRMKDLAFFGQHGMQANC
jgi:hypothetical protein